MGVAMIRTQHLCPGGCVPVSELEGKEASQPGVFLSQGSNFGSKSTLEVLYV